MGYKMKFNTHILYCKLNWVLDGLENKLGAIYEMRVLKIESLFYNLSAFVYEINTEFEKQINNIVHIRKIINYVFNS